MKENEQEKPNKYVGISYEESILTRRPKNDPLSIILWHLAPYRATLDLASELSEPLLPAPSETSGAAQNFKTSAPVLMDTHRNCAVFLQLIILEEL